MKKLSFAITLAFVFSVGAARAQTGWYIDTRNFDHPSSPDTVAGGGQNWHNQNNNNWLCFEKNNQRDSISILVIDYDRPNHPDTITNLHLHLDKKLNYRWHVDKITITKYGKRPDGKISPIYDAHLNAEKFGKLTERIISRMKN